MLISNLCTWVETWWDIWSYPTLKSKLIDINLYVKMSIRQLFWCAFVWWMRAIETSVLCLTLYSTGNCGPNGSQLHQMLYCWQTGSQWVTLIVRQWKHLSLAKAQPQLYFYKFGLFIDIHWATFTNYVTSLTSLLQSLFSVCVFIFPFLL